MSKKVLSGFVKKAEQMWNSVGNEIRKPDSYKLALAFSKDQQATFDEGVLSMLPHACGQMGFMCESILAYYGEVYEEDIEMLEFAQRFK